ncbi:MAG: ABC transporter ATPase [Patiriisocius sp.]
MLVDFNKLPDTSRIWVYQSNRKFTDQELEYITAKTRYFLTQWTAHGAELEAGFQIRYDRFIVLGLNQENASASGCSIDASVHFIQELQEKMGVDLLDKMNVTYYNGAYIAHKNLLDFRKMAKNKSVSANTVVFNNLVNTKAQYKENWEVAAKDSWHSRFLA